VGHVKLPSLAELRALPIAKWAAVGDDGLAAWIAEMDFGIAPEIETALQEAITSGAVGYPTPAMWSDVADAVTGWYLDETGYAFDPAHVQTTVDIITALQVTIERVVPPGAPIVVPTPAYMPFLTLPDAIDRELVEVPLANDGGVFTYDLDALDAALTKGGLVIVCNPQNPTGRVNTRDELAEVADVIERRGAFAFVDEVHSPIRYDGRAHVPYASVSDAAANHSLTVTSAGKGWGIPGLKCGVSLVTSPTARAAFAPIAADLAFGPSTPGLIATAAAFRDARAWVANVVHYLAGNRQTLADLVGDHLPGAVLTWPEGTYVAWLELGPVLEAGFRGYSSPAALLEAEAGVKFTPGRECGEVGVTAVRIVFATPRPVLTEMIERIAAVL